MAQANVDRFELKVESLADLKARLAALSALLVEARVILVVQEADMTPAVRKKKMEHLIGKIGDHTLQFAVPVRPLILKSLLSMAMQRITSP